MEEFKKPSYKYCIVPNCKNTISSTPNKVFFSIPRDAKIRKQWCKIMRRSMVSAISCLYCCEDHFNLENDMENYLQYKIMGSIKKIRIRPQCEPTRFECQAGAGRAHSDRFASGKKKRKSLKEVVEEDVEQKALALRCAVGKCGRGPRRETPHDVTFFKFPVEPCLRAAWGAALDLEGVELDERSAVCAEHFVQEDLSVTDMGLTLREGAVPVLYAQACRVCLAGRRLRPLAEHRPLRAAYEHLTGLSLENESHLPPYLCADCSRLLLQYARFRTKSLRTHLVLLEIFKKNDCITLKAIQSFVENPRDSDVTLNGTECESDVRLREKHSCVGEENRNNIVKTEYLSDEDLDNEDNIIRHKSENPIEHDIYDDATTESIDKEHVFNEECNAVFLNEDSVVQVKMENENTSEHDDVSGGFSDDDTQSRADGRGGAGGGEGASDEHIEIFGNSFKRDHSYVKDSRNVIKDSTMAESTSSEESSNGLVVPADVHYRHCSQLSAAVAAAESSLRAVEPGYPKTAAERMREYRARKKKENQLANHRKPKKSGAQRVRECRARQKDKAQSLIPSVI